MNATDRIDSARPFAQNVDGPLDARFRLDSDGAPLYEVSDGVRVYPIDVCLLSPRADEIDEVSYGTVKSTNRDNDFRAMIEADGDTFLTVRVRIGNREYEQFAWLSQMLDNGYAKGTTSAIQSAPLYIRVN